MEWGLARALVVSVSMSILPCFAVAADVTAGEIVRHCEYKNPGEDQLSRLSISLIDKDGNERKSVYERLWKNYHGKEGVLDKMVLFTDFPPDAKGTGFMRWGYTAASEKLADQWLYLPQLRKIRRVSVRDLGDSFLGSDLTYGDIEERTADADEHVLVRVDELKGERFRVVESVPKEARPLYSKKISWYGKVPDWSGCYRAKTEYYDPQGILLKTQTLAWQQVDGAWAWDKVEVVNHQTKHKSLFEVTDVKVGVGLEDRQFTERELKRGP
jgi:hypothetical protein